jgi:GH43 family beta-xylosidase
MSDLRESSALGTYLNPVYPKSFADPFIIKFNGEYIGYSTGLAADGNVFGVIRSDDLIRWTDVGGAMKPLEPSPPHYWAPEVTYDNGKFYLYYSVGNETFMEIRVAVSDRPDSGFVDSGHRLTSQQFAIDAHVFIDDDGSKYLFYATDFLEYSHIGTGTVVDRMLDWFTLEGNPKPVTRAKYDWQVYDPNRKEKGGVRWHTVEGPAVLKRKNLYYEMFSGGNWQNTSYGVSFAVSKTIENSDEWSQFSDGAKVLPILRTLGDTVVGPGHNCIVRGPNNRELFCVYHRWIDGNRVMAIDRLDFAGERMFVLGASHTPQPAPFEPTAGALDRELSRWKKTGNWRVEERSLISDAKARSEIQLSVPQSFLCELTFACPGEPSDDSRIVIRFDSSRGPIDLTFLPISGGMRMEGPRDRTDLPMTCELPAEFDWNAPHRLRFEADYRRLTIELDQIQRFDTFLPVPMTSVSICSENQSIELSSYQLTEGFEELFETSDSLTDNGWEINSDIGHRIVGGELIFESRGSLVMRKHPALESCEFAANFRLIETDSIKGEFGLSLRNGEQEILRYTVDCENSVLKINADVVRTLPGGVNLRDYHQVRVIKKERSSLCYFDDMLIAEVTTAPIAADSFIFGEDVQLAIEMIRVTAI